MRRAGLGVMLGLVMAGMTGAALAAPPQQLSHGRFENVPVHLPDGHPQRVVVWFDGAAGRADSQHHQRPRQDEM